MKNKLFLITGFLTLLITISSCRRDYVCTCSFNSVGGGISVPYSASFPINNTTRADANKQCEDAYCPNTWAGNPNAQNKQWSVH